MTPIERVQQMYGAFGRGDIPAILEALADDVEWEYNAFPNPVPWLQLRKGRAEVAKFFEALAAVQFTQFEPKHFFAAGNLGDPPLALRRRRQGGEDAPPCRHLAARPGAEGRLTRTLIEPRSRASSPLPRRSLRWSIPQGHEGAVPALAGPLALRSRALPPPPAAQDAAQHAADDLAAHRRADAAHG
jgi:hypothetical protein